MLNVKEFIIVGVQNTEVDVFSRWYFALISMSGVFAVTFSIVFAYVADVTDESERSSAYGLVSATFAASLVTSPALGAYLGKVCHLIPDNALSLMIRDFKMVYMYNALESPSWQGDQKFPQIGLPFWCSTWEAS